MNRWVALVVLLASLVACAPPVSQEEFDEAVAGLQGLAGSRLDCHEEVFGHSCSAELALEADASADHISAAIEALHDVELHRVRLEFDSERDVTASLTDRASASLVAAGLVAARDDARIERAEVHGDHAELTMQPGTLAQAATLREDFLAAAAFPGLTVWARTGDQALSLRGGVDDPPGPALELAVAVEDRYPVSAGRVAADEALLVLASSADLQAAREFAERQPERDQVPWFDLSDGHDLVLQPGAEDEMRRRALEAIAVLRGEPGFVRLVAGSSLTVDVDGVRRITDLEELLLREVEGYADDAVAWRVRGHARVEVERDPGEQLLVEPVVQLVGQGPGRWHVVDMRSRSEGTSLDVTAGERVGPGEAARLLASTDLATRDVRVVLRWRTEGTSGTATFTTGGATIDPQVSKVVSDEDLEELRAGWAAGQ